MTPEGTADGPDVALTEAELQRLSDAIYGRGRATGRYLRGPVPEAVTIILADRLAAVTEQRDQYAAQVARVEALPRHRMSVGWANYHVLMVTDDDLRAALRADRGGEDLAEEGRRLASRREDLIAQGVDPAELEVPIFPADPTRGIMSTTSDPNDPRLTRGVNDKPVDQAETYLVLSDEERSKGFVRPLRLSYMHARDLGGCGATTTMGQAIAETYAREPRFYGATYCVGCMMHRPVGDSGEFVWVERGAATDIKVGT